MQADALFKAVADKNRLRIISLLLGGPKFVEQIAAELNISVSTASFHLEKLKAASLVCDEKVQYYKRYRLNGEILKKSIIDVISSEDNVIEDDKFSQSAVKEFYVDGRLKKLPVQTYKKKAVLIEAAKGLISKKGLTEREVDWRLSAIFEDFVRLRKEMVAFGIITLSENGKYFVNKKISLTYTGG